MTPEETRDLIAEARLAACSECSEEGTSPAMRCDGDLIRRLGDALEDAEARLAALTIPQEAKSAAKVVPVSYEASASCSHGVCPTGCSHLMWQCSTCSCEGGWGASREQLEEIAAKHECPPTPQEGDAHSVADRLARAFDGNDGDDLGAAQGEGALHLALAFPIREAIEDVYADCGDSDPRVLSTNIAQRLAYLLPPAILATFPVLSRAAVPEPEWEYGIRGGSGLMLPELFSDVLDAQRFAGPDALGRAVLRRRKAGPWLPVGGES